jgi:hypothetical protein
MVTALRPFFAIPAKDSPGAELRKELRPLLLPKWTHGPRTTRQDTKFEKFFSCGKHKKKLCDIMVYNISGDYNSVAKGSKFRPQNTKGAEKLCGAGKICSFVLH